MDNFRFYNPTELVFGKDTQKQVGEMVRKYSDCEKVLVVYGSERVRKNGLMDEVLESLKKAGIEAETLGGVKPNPRLSLVRQGIEICRRENIRFVLAVGGASVIDTAKTIGVGVPYEGDVWDFFLGKDTPVRTLPTAAICTIPAAGSESSLSAVITNEDGWFKKSINLDLIRPVFSILNPELTFTLPAYQIGCGVVDMFSHVTERYFTNTQNVDVTDRLCEGLMRSIIYNGIKTYEHPQDYDARAEIVWAGTVAHNGSLNVGREQDWASHRIGIELSGKYDLAHGASLSIVLPAWMRYVYKHDIGRFVQFAVRVWDVDMAFGAPEEIVEEGISRMCAFFHRLNMPTSLKEAGLPCDAFEEMADKCTFGDTIPVGHFVPIWKSDAIAIYNMCAE